MTLAGASVEGWLGSYCWEGTCADVADVPDKGQLPLIEGEAGDAAFALSDDVAFVSWRATYDDGQGDPIELGAGGEDFDPDAVGVSPPPELLEATFPTPGEADGVVTVQVFLGNGDISYAWHLVAQ